MTSSTTPLLRALSIALLFITLTGAVDAGAETGPVVGWGNDAYGQAMPPDAINGWGSATNIAAGSFHSCAIQTGTGNVICWGDDNYGEVAPPDDVNGVTGTATDIAAGDNHTLALPEPTALTALGSGIAMLALLYRRRLHSAEQ
jgi:alpha-tubulin suppressor-like RCC1 family protein